jgi:hypothetical protein
MKRADGSLLMNKGRRHMINIIPGIVSSYSTTAGMGIIFYDFFS